MPIRATQPRQSSAADPKSHLMLATSSSNSISTIASPTRVASACALIVAAIGLVFLASWLVVFKAPTPLLPDPASMKFNAALCFVLAGAGLWWRDHGTARVLAGFVISAVGVLTLGQQFLPVNLGIDQAFIRDLATAPASWPGRMSDLAAISFVLCGLALALLRAGSRKVRLGAEALVLCVAATQFIAFLGHATGFKFLDGVPGLHSAAVSIAAGFCIFAIGLFAGLKEGVTGRPADPTSPTRRRVQLGFGLWTALLVTVGIFSAARLHALEASVNALAVNARVRLAETQELKINLLDFGLNVRVFQSGDAASLNRADEAAADVARHLAAYSRLAVTPPQITYAARVAAQWQDVYVAGQALLTASPAAPEELSRLSDQRLGLEQLLEDEVQPDASASVARAEADIASGLQNAKIGTLALLVVALSCALITSSLVGQTVLGGELALREREERLRLATGAAELGIWTWNPDKDRVAGENGLFYGILGLAQSSLPLSVAGFATKFVHPEDRETFGRAIKESLLNETRTRWDGRFHTTQGDPRWIELTGQAVPDLQGT